MTLIQTPHLPEHEQRDDPPHPEQLPQSQHWFGPSHGCADETAANADLCGDERLALPAEVGADQLVETLVVRTEVLDEACPDFVR